MNKKFLILCSLLIIQLSQASSSILYTTPTLDNGNHTNNTYIIINSSILTSNPLNEFIINWNNINYSFYNSSLILSMNFNNISEIGENKTKVIDTSMYGNNGTIDEDMITTNGKFNKAIKFDGTYNYINLDRDYNFSTNNTISFWAKINKQNYLGVVGSNKGNYGYIRFGRGINEYNRNLYFETNIDNDFGQLTFDSIISNDTWYQFTIVRQSSTWSLYINGILQSNTAESLNNLTIRRIGQGRKDTDYFNGSIDELRIWNRALSLNEIKMYYQSEFQKYNSSEWRFYNNVSWSNYNIENLGINFNPTKDPIGGGTGYSKIVHNNSSIAYHVSTKEELLSSLLLSIGGDVIYINDNAEIDLTLEHDLMIPAGVTIASGRGNGSSPGALLYNNNLKFTNGSEEVFTLFKTSGVGVRFTGIRLKGNDGEIRQSAGEYILSRGIYSEYEIEVDNSELTNWTHCAVCLYYNSTSNIHHNFIHHNRRIGYGYGIVHAYGANSIIEANIFDWNRHSIAGDGRVNTSYTARYNVVLENGNSHSFDMHGGADRNDGTNIAGETINIYGNTFHKVSDVNNSYPAVVIRGTPTNVSWIHDNYFYYDFQDYSIRQINSVGNVNIYNNVYNGYLDYIKDDIYTYYGQASDILNNSINSKIITNVIKTTPYNKIYKGLTNNINQNNITYNRSINIDDVILDSLIIPSSYDNFSITPTIFNITYASFNESSNNITNTARYTICDRNPSTSHTIKIFWNNGTKFQDFYVKSNNTGCINYNSTGFESPRYTIITQEEPSRTYKIGTITGTVIIGGIILYLTRFKINLKRK